MKITLNNREESFDFDKISIAQIMELKKFTFSKIIIKLNGDFVEKENYETTMVKNADILLIIHLLAGG